MMTIPGDEFEIKSRRFEFIANYEASEQEEIMKPEGR